MCYNVCVRKISFGIFTLLAAALLQTGCDRRTVGHATQQASDEFSLLQEEMMTTLQEGDMTREEAEEIDELLQHFAATADAAFATPKSGLTMLHLACLYKHAELARCLLLDGASPNATLKSAYFCGLAEPGATPLMLAVSQDSPEVPEEDILQLTQHLLQAGAVVNMQREGQLCSRESVYLALLNKAETLPDLPAANEGIPVSVGKVAAEHGWHKALNELLRRRNNKLTEGDAYLLHYVCANSTAAPGYIECARLLLLAGIPVNGQDPHGVTPLFAHLTGPDFQQGDGTASLNLVELLLNNGADTGMKAERDPEFPGFSAMDFLMTKPLLMEQLKQRGFSLQIPPIQWDSVNDLPREICRAHLKETVESRAEGSSSVSADTRQHFETLAGILRPDNGLRRHPLYVEALASGIELMARIDTVRTAERLAEMPMWLDPLVWKEQHPHALTVLQILTDTPGLVLPRDIVCRTAEVMEQQNQPDLAAAMLELLGRCPDADADIARYEQDARPSLQAGALQARLLRAGLPAARCYAVRDWLAHHGRQADTPVLKTAVLLTSQEDIWFGSMSRENLNAVLAAMEQVGAPQAARAYRDIAASLNDADRLDSITSDSHIWKFELECATARFILQHADHFLPSSSREEKNTD